MRTPWVWAGLLACFLSASGIRVSSPTKQTKPGDLRPQTHNPFFDWPIKLYGNRKNQCEDYITPKMCEAKEEQSYTASLVVSTYMEDLAWLNEMFFDGNVTVYVHDRATQRSHGSKDSFGDHLRLAEMSEVEVRSKNNQRKYPIAFETIPNKGDEASAYLSYIIKKYYKLPEVVFFVQGHRCAQHAQFDMSKALPNIKRCFNMKTGYVDLNTYHMKKKHFPTCKNTSIIIEHPIRGFHIEDFEGIWDQLFKEELGPMPDRVCWDGYAQFGVKRELIQRHPVSFYKKLFHGVLNGTTTMEFFWKMVFVPSAITRFDHKEERYQALVEYIMQRR